MNSFGGVWRKYEERLQKYKDKEEKVIEEKIISLKAEYKRNLDFAYSQVSHRFTDTSVFLTQRLYSV